MPDEDKKKDEKLFGMYRAKVVDNKDPEKYGRVKVWVPDVMPEIEDTKGLWAFPANNPVGGRNSEGENSKYYGSSYVPEKGSWIWVFFESGNPNRPYYLGALDLKAVKVLPECQLGGEYERKWVIFKSREGRVIMVSDDADDCRVEITGKKRQISSEPEGDTSSVYTIDGNQTSILLDEREGKEKLLIRTHKGDFVNIDIENRKLYIQFQSDIHIKSNQSIYVYATNDINLKAMGKVNSQSGGAMNLKAGSNLANESSATISFKGGSNVDTDSGAKITHNSGLASGAEDSVQAEGKGERDG